MSAFSRYAFSLWVSAILLAVVGFSGCEGHGSYSTYDPEYHDYHVWNDDELAYYGRWEKETHRDHKEFRDRDKDEQGQYWNWRHSQPSDHH
jgi:hypothetical protein